MVNPAIEPPDSLRALNRQRILGALREIGPATRADLTGYTKLSRTTVTSILDDLASEELITARNSPHRGPGGGSGRPPAVFSIAALSGVVAALDLGHSHIRVAVADLSGSIQAELHEPIDVDVSAESAIEVATTMLAAAMRKADAENELPRQIVMGIPGPLDRESGAVGSTSILPGWVDLVPAAELERRMGSPVIVDNDANLGAAGEVAFGAGRGFDDVVYVKISTGIGAGLILGGRIYRGSAGIAGEIGHVPVQEDGVVCRCGNRGCLETVSSAPALLTMLQPAHPESLSIADIARLATGGDLGAIRVLSDAGRTVGRVVADLVNNLNPAAVIIGGDLSLAGDTVVDGLAESIHRYAQPAAATSAHITRGALGLRAEILGGIAVAVQMATRQHPAAAFTA
ncbi:MAG TPA: ROK family transcriptional regulator [Mycobacteriales bacterium]|nr:ROK family transcriptional regulator [Mycobacteriales bacterium]